MSGSPRIGSTVIGCFRSFTSTLQASTFTPLIIIASDPQMPCAHERRRASELSSYHFTLWRQVEQAVHRLGVDGVVLEVRLGVLLGVEALDRAA